MGIEPQMQVFIPGQGDFFLASQPDVERVVKHLIRHNDRVASPSFRLLA